MRSSEKTSVAKCRSPPDDEPDLANVLRFAMLHEEAYQQWFAWMETRTAPDGPQT
jgi:hypothetical protein